MASINNLLWNILIFLTTAFLTIYMKNSLSPLFFPFISSVIFISILPIPFLLLPSKPLIPQMSTSSSQIKAPDQDKFVVVVLDLAPLEIVKVGKPSSSSKDCKYHLLNCDDHQGILRKANRDLSQYRPDITHQCLLTLLDSPLNKAGHLRIFIRTQKRVLIEVNPKTRIPRTYTRFAGLIVQLLHKLAIKSVQSDELLLNIIKNPITDHLPVDCIRIGLSGDSSVVQLKDYVKKLPLVQPEHRKTAVFFVGAMAHGKDTFEDVESFVSISNYSLTASVACSKICDAFEELWNIH